MQTFKQLYESMVKSVLNNDLDPEKDLEISYDPHHLDCLLNPKKHGDPYRSLFLFQRGSGGVLKAVSVWSVGNQKGRDRR